MGTRLRRGAKRTIAFLLTTAVLVAGVIAFSFRQDIQDHFRALGFDPSARTIEVMDFLQLTDRGERVFLASRPTVDGSQLFNAQCSGVNHSEEGHVLGCYTGERIHLFDVPDPRIGGIVEVTAAHELLHATFDRLSDGERAALTERLMTAYDVLSLEHPELVERMSVYAHLSATAFANELHSVLGTEVRDLPSWLEQRYGDWFKNRDALIDHFESFHAVFVELEDQAKTLETEMTALRADVERRNAEYDATVHQFNLDAADLRRRNENFEFSDNPAEFNRMRDELAKRRAAIQSTLDGLQADIDRYNAMREELQKLSQQSTELQEKLNSELAPVTSQPEE
ncbi:hypothetical protein G7067_09195 [Leucobacter insecticola]|uniref:Uncharacterized protein n=1 Tax=Leucobacter insecticola TaxID=2714934 RepID=A0A6G8FJB2_9MICO|nr:hypothetical protein [Leucobacter insecticola]QIM16546.1 hypothetical protein G7067_09195 [Leucobacter insecticola]